MRWVNLQVETLILDECLDAVGEQIGILRHIRGVYLIQHGVGRKEIGRQGFCWIPVKAGGDFRHAAGPGRDGTGSIASAF